MNLHPLRGRKIVERVRDRGNVWRGKHMRMTYITKKVGMRNEESGTLYVGTSASTKLHKSAVKRNRMRRRCREALRITLLQATTYHLQPSYQLLISPRRSSLTCDFGDLKQDVQRFLSHIRER